jgi:phage terminase small subunit
MGSAEKMSSADPDGGPIEHEDMTNEQLEEALQELGYGRRKNQLEEKLDNS